MINIAHQEFGLNTKMEIHKYLLFPQPQTKVGFDYQYKVEINGMEVEALNNTQPQEFNNISNPWYPALPGNVRNIHIKGNV